MQRHLYLHSYNCCWEYASAAIWLEILPVTLFSAGNFAISREIPSNHVIILRHADRIIPLVSSSYYYNVRLILLNHIYKEDADQKPHQGSEDCSKY
jgi:hypothetical protein